ncbi:MAG: CBS domain-containing protein, partial [Trebonia sp.]
IMPGGSSSTWALLGMAGALAGVTRSPFTSIVFAFELTHDTGSLLPLLVTCTIAHFISVVVLKRSILTEKVARRGFHVMREYEIEPTEALFVREAMQQDVLTVDPEQPLAVLVAGIAARQSGGRQRLYPVTDGGTRLVGIITPSDLLSAVGEAGETPRVVRDIMRQNVLVTYPDEILRAAANQMAELCVGALPVVTRDTGQLLGVLTEFDLLKARQRQMAEERHRERVLRLRRLNPAAPAVEVVAAISNGSTSAPDAMPSAAMPPARAAEAGDPRQPGLPAVEPDEPNGQADLADLAELAGEPAEPGQAPEHVGGPCQTEDSGTRPNG